jgi:hypothetical protein
MMNELEGSKQSGTFTIALGNELYGELTLAGSKTSLHLRDESFFSPNTPDRSLKGVLHDLRKVTLVDCISPGTGTASYGTERYHFADIFPHYVIYGDDHVTPNDRKITEVQLVVDDASTLFYDFDAFGNVTDAAQFIGPIIDAREKAYNRKIKTGPGAQLLYFAGNFEILAADTVLGRVSVSHNPSFNLGGPEGVWLKNTISVTIAFSEEQVFDEAIFRCSTLLRYLAMLVGRPQNLCSLSLRIKSDIGGPGILQVYWSLPPRRDSSKEGRKPHPADVLLQGANESEQFSKVMARWLDRQQSWHAARMRFHTSFAEQRHYDVNRLIGAANMFDILPSSAIPRDVDLTDELKAAKDCSLRIFKSLQPSPEQESVLSNLGRVGKSNLKHKIRHRVQILIAATGDRFKDLPLVTDQAVNCRNHYVHGSDARFEYDRNFDAVTFFVDTLEFVFAASDLIEAGWDAQAWIARPTGMSHPFGAYRVNYATNLIKLQALLK